jgi:predicted transcriptional regulator
MSTSNVRLPDALRERVDELAEREDRSAGAVVRRAVSFYVAAADLVQTETTEEDE